MNREAFISALSCHRKWLENSPSGDARPLVCEGMDLRHFDFREFPLTFAKFINCDLSGCDFRGTELRYVDFKKCRLAGTDFRGAKVHGALMDEESVEAHGAEALTPIGVVAIRTKVWSAVLYRYRGTLRVTAGCRDFTLEEALQHWWTTRKEHTVQCDWYAPMMYEAVQLGAKIMNERGW